MVPAASSPQSLISDPAVVVLGVGLRSIPANKGDAIPPRLFDGGSSMAKVRSSFLLATLCFVLAGFIVPVQQLSAQGPVSVTIESWRNDDLPVWQDTIIPAFTKRYPNIKVVFGPTAPTEYNAALNAKFSGGTAGDLITCRPFDLSLGLFKQGFLAPVNDLPGMSNFGPVAKSAWITDDGKTVFCVPMASVIHGFIYNADIFKQLGLTPPKTEAEFSRCWTRSSRTAGTRPWLWAPRTSGKRRPWDSRTLAPTTGKASRAGWR